MAEFIRTEEKVVNVGDPVIFENNTDSDFSVSAAIVFRKSGLYDVSIVGRRTIVSKISKQPEIIGCKDCKHRGEKPISDGRYWCNIHNAFMYYCSDAERITEYGKEPE